jgi:hypothetical protein
MSEQIRKCGEEFLTKRSEIMLNSGLGLTELYNRMHSININSPEIVLLRSMHDELDEVVAKCYGWTDLDMRKNFVSPSQEDNGILERLLPENTVMEIMARLIVENGKRKSK